MAPKKRQRKPSKVVPLGRARRKTIARKPERPATSAGSSDLIIVGVGASAGGLEAFTLLLQSLPPDPGFAMVLVQHLAPQHESALPVLLSARTNLEVVQAVEGARVERNHVYVIPPNLHMGIADGRLHLTPRPSDRSRYNPIDFFLRCLAESVQERAIGVVLSGTASDGALGIRDIKAVGGITIAQKPESAKYDGMPRAAIATGLVDLVLTPPEIARELMRISSHPLRREPPSATPAETTGDASLPREEDLEQIFALLRTATGVDFRRYKRPTIQRRLHRRMVLHKLTRVDRCLKLLRERPAEVQLLYQDILIHVTRFFREPESFEAITTYVLPKITQALRDERPIRVWVPGCSTGEEAYSIAMVVLEYLDGATAAVPLQVFATDISDTAIEHARSGFYPQSIVTDVSAERLRRYFSKIDGGYRISKAVRDTCIFARQDLTRDPPFSKLDLILCRNVLIYMGSELQRRLMGVFHYALKPTGFLVLGAAETIGPHSDLFAVADKRHRIHQKRLASVPDVRFPLEYPAVAPTQGRQPAVVAREESKSAQGEANRIVQDRYAPPGVIVDADLHIVQFRGQTGAYLEPAPGDPSMNLLKMAREGLLHGVRSALQEARKSRAPVRKKGVRVRSNGGWEEVDVEVVPLSAAERAHFLVLFDSSKHPKPAVDRQRERPAPPIPLRRHDKRMAELHQELATSREYLQSIIQELEAANEELQSANEEVLSANEELQSTNEELDTAKEELQSTNEELNTVNEELHGRNEELSRLNSDLMNLLASVQVGIVIVASDLRIRRFTPMAERVLNLLPGDVGRPIGHIKPNIDCPDLEERILQVIDTVTSFERDVSDDEGNCYSLRVRPYKNVENRIDGAVVALVDMQGSSGRIAADRTARTFAEAITHLIQQPMILLDGEGHVRMANEAFYDTFGGTRDVTEGKPLVEVGGGEWNTAAFRDGLDATLRADGRKDPVELRHDFRSVGAKTLRLLARRAEDGAHGTVVVVSVSDAPRGSR